MKRGELKISTFIISMLVVSAILTMLIPFIAKIGTEYKGGFDSGIEAEMRVYDQFVLLNDTTSELEQEVLNKSKSTSGVTDIIGLFIGSGFNALKLSYQSLEGMTLIVDGAADTLQLGTAFKVRILGIISIILVFIVISALIGRNI